MKLLFLRGRVPEDRNPRQIMFDHLDECDDMWTQLASHLCKNGQGLVWYWGGKRKVEYASNFLEWWTPTYKKEIPFIPDVIFARGGFPQYDSVMRRFPNAFKIYYGAGRRFMPRHSFKRYDLVLVDTPKQAKKVQSALPSSVELFIKPAADNVFKPVSKRKKYDVIFVGNEHPKGIKGQGFVLPKLSKYSAVHVGMSRTLHKKYPNIHFTKWIPRKKIPHLYAQSKVAVVAADRLDSCPRVIPEALACDCPLLCLDSVRFWHEKYITPQTGKICSKRDFDTTLRWMVDNHQSFQPFDYYRDNLSLSVSAAHIRFLIEKKGIL